jgi:hypothetical protein
VNRAIEPDRVLTDIAMCVLAVGAKVQAALVDTAFGLVGYLRAIRAQEQGR